MERKLLQPLSRLQQRRRQQQQLQQQQWKQHRHTISAEKATKTSSGTESIIA
jgi:hypothetical protein